MYIHFKYIDLYNTDQCKDRAKFIWLHIYSSSYWDSTWSCHSCVSGHESCVACNQPRCVEIWLLTKFNRDQFSSYCNGFLKNEDH